MLDPINLGPYPQLRNNGYQLTRGWSDELAAQLVAGSREKQIMQSTPNDMGVRFVDVDTANEWYEEKLPTVYALARTAHLAGIIWFSHRPRPEYSADYTFAIRMYDIARGKQLAEPFIEASEADFRATAEPEGIWLETELDNSPARNLYHKIGYTVIAAQRGRITMRR